MHTVYILVLFSFRNILLDISGGVLSLMQLVGDAIDLNDLSSITGNMAKLGLSAVSIFFDVSSDEQWVWFPYVKELTNF